MTMKTIWSSSFEQDFNLFEEARVFAKFSCLFQSLLGDL